MKYFPVLNDWHDLLVCTLPPLSGVRVRRRCPATHAPVRSQREDCVLVIKLQAVTALLFITPQVSWGGDRGVVLYWTENGREVKTI